ncbi:hypothetical protein GQ42DRAFT_156334 [Ramicandelaber brevisporus]|nr:hypothetical protein GQ42DRAFT_156334 [Ramicandelaber brevisporus]
MKFAIAFAVALASLAALNSAQDTVSNVDCKEAKITIGLDPGLTNTAKDIEGKLRGSSSSCTFDGKPNADPNKRNQVKITVKGNGSGSCGGSGTTSGDTKATGIPDFSGTATVEAWELGDKTGKKLFTVTGPVKGKITSDGITLKGKIEEGKGEGKIIRISGGGTSAAEKKKEAKECKSADGYAYIEGTLDLISITDN